MRALIYLSALLITALFAIVLSWAFEHEREARRSSTLTDDEPRLSFRPGAHLARRAVRAFRALSANEQQALRAELAASTSTLDRWASEQANVASLLCLGERHEDSTRAFIASEILPRLNYQVLMVEASRPRLQSLLEHFDKAQPALLLGASLNGVLRAVKARQPAARLVAIDEYQPRKHDARLDAKTHAAKPRGREISLADRIREEWRPGQHHAVLLGALHCRAMSGWMMHQLRYGAPEIRQAGAISVVILARYREASAQALMYLLDEIGLGQKTVVIPQVSRFPKQLQQWLPFTADAFAGYNSAILFDDQAAHQ